MIIKRLTFKQYEAAHRKNTIETVDGQVTEKEWNTLYGGDVILYMGEKMPDERTPDDGLEEIDDAVGQKLVTQTQESMARIQASVEPEKDAFGRPLELKDLAE